MNVALARRLHSELVHEGAAIVGVVRPGRRSEDTVRLLRIRFCGTRSMVSLGGSP